MQTYKPVECFTGSHGEQKDRCVEQIQQQLDCPAHVLNLVPGFWASPTCGSMMSPFLRAILWSTAQHAITLGHEGRACFYCLKENRAPACFHHPESSLDDVPGTGLLAVIASLYRVLYRLPVWGDEADGFTQARIATIPKDALACR